MTATSVSKQFIYVGLHVCAYMNVLLSDIVGRICDFSVYGCEMRGHRLTCGGLCDMTLVEQGWRERSVYVLLPLEEC